MRVMIADADFAARERMARSSVDFPAPFGPSTAVRLPQAIAALT